jgi:anti-sigma factor RsiW
MRTWWSPGSNGRPADCRGVARLIQHHLDGELDEEAARVVAQHLEMCLRCGLEASTYRQLQRHLARLQEPVDDAVLERLRRFVDELNVDR